MAIEAGKRASLVRVTSGPLAFAIWNLAAGPLKNFLRVEDRLGRSIDSRRLEAVSGHGDDGDGDGDGDDDGDGDGDDDGDGGHGNDGDGDRDGGDGDDDDDGDGDDDGDDGDREHDGDDGHDTGALWCW